MFKSKKSSKSDKISKFNKMSKSNKLSKSRFKNKNLWIIIIAVIIIVLILFAVILIYDIQRRESFNSKYLEMNDAYSKVLAATSNEDPNAENLMFDYVMKWSEFYESYNQRPVPPFTNDINWSSSLSIISGEIFNATESVNMQDYVQAHYALLHIKTVWTDIFTRNDVSPITNK